MYLQVFDLQFNRIGIIDEYQSIKMNRKWSDHSEMTIETPLTMNILNTIYGDNNGPFIFCPSNDLKRGYISDTIEYEDENVATVTIIAKSLSYLLSFRTVNTNEVYNSQNVQTVVHNYVNRNAVNPSDVKRKLPNLIIQNCDQPITETTTESFLSESLDSVVWSIVNKFDMSYEITMDHANKKFIFKILKGVNRSAEQSENSRVIFAKQFDNVIRQRYTNDSSSMKNAAYIFGHEDDEPMMTVEIGSEFSGYERREYGIDATDVPRIYTDEEGVEVHRTPSEWQAALTEKGKSELVDLVKLDTFETDINTSTSHIYGKTYNLGDIVSNRSDDLGIISHARVDASDETYNRNGYSVSITFGKSIPTLVDKIKRSVK